MNLCSWGIQTEVEEVVGLEIIEDYGAQPNDIEQLEF